jgi:DNA-binding transcriptional MerR regulator
MFEKTWAPKPIPDTYVLTPAVSEVAGVDKKSLLEWVACGLLPPPLSARGRGIVSKWPLITLELAKFVREYRDKGFALREIRPFLVKAFGPRILQVVEEPQSEGRRRGRDDEEDHRQEEGRGEEGRLPRELRLLALTSSGGGHGSGPRGAGRAKSRTCSTPSPPTKYDPASAGGKICGRSGTPGWCSLVAPNRELSGSG